MRKKKERSKQGQTNKQRGKATQHTQGNHFSELPRVGLEPTTLYTLDRALYQLSYRGSSAGWAQISHLIVHLHDEQANHQLSMKEKAGVMKPPMTPNTKPSIYMFLNEEERKKQARSNKQGKATQHTQGSRFSSFSGIPFFHLKNNFCGVFYCISVRVFSHGLL